MGSAYDRVLAKYDWAEQHVSNFEAAVDSFRLTNSHSIGRKNDVETGEYIYYVKTVPVIPASFSLMLGDALHNLRSTLDHLAVALVEAGSEDPNPKTCFPIFDTPKAYSVMSRGKVPGLGEHTLYALDNIQPYKGGFGHWAWQLHQLDIRDKHRMLLTVCSIPVARSVLPGEKTLFYTRKSVIIGGTSVFFRQMLFAPQNPSIRAAQAGDELGRFPALTEYENVGFSFEIAIDEAGIAEGMPTYLLLRNLSGEVYKTVSDLSRFL
jgi:hypothetical protein